MEWAILPFKRYADFKGRSRRMEFWMFSVLNFLVMMVLFGIAITVGGGMAALSGAEPGDPSAIMGLLTGGFGIIVLLWWLATIVPSIAVTVRRLHDRDMSGWWYLGFIVLSLIPFIGILASLGFLVLMFLEGTRGPNRFGPDPKDPGSVDVFS